MTNRSPRPKQTLSFKKAPLPQEQDSDDIEQDYQYVISDLKRVAIVAAIVFALLIALSFFIG